MTILHPDEPVRLYYVTARESFERTYSVRARSEREARTLVERGSVDINLEQEFDLDTIAITSVELA